MDKLITALAPVFAAGLAIQQLGEILSPVIDKIAADNKKVILGLISLILGLALAFMANLHVLQILGVTPTAGVNIVDGVVTGLIISGGTEGVNSILKFLKYKKEEVKNDAAAGTPANKTNANAANVAVPSEAALSAMDKK
ncbi:MAG TPA: hypothetical protein VN696_10115 [Pyrinomonadaceae bacterium]|nr:hypothetical protein [Pyrinomonadaceae bacterium]